MGMKPISFLVANLVAHLVAQLIAMLVAQCEWTIDGSRGTRASPDFLRFENFVET